MNVFCELETVGCIVGEGDGEDVDEVEEERLAQREGRRLLAGQAGREKLFLTVTVDSLLCCGDKHFKSSLCFHKVCKA